RADPLAQRLVLLERRAVLRDRLLRVVARAAPARLLLEHAAEHAALQRAPRDETEAVRLACGHHLELDRAIDQVVERLLAYEPVEVTRARRLVRLRDVPAGEIRGADVDHLALLDEGLHRLPDLVPR